MNPLCALSARAIAQQLAQRQTTALAVAQAYIERVESLDGAVRAWQFFDPALVLQQAMQVDAQQDLGPLAGVPLGVKDLIDTADMPTAYGSTLYAGHRPVADAACVAASRAAGAVLLGKTVTTEYASFTPGVTRNPCAAPGRVHTPGGSSSGSAAAVAAGMVPLALGTQTAGSIIRPAAYCGVVGYKPTHGTLPLAGVKSIGPSLDTVGVLARSVDDAAFLVGALARLNLRPQARPVLRVGVCHTPNWARADPDSRQALATAAGLLDAAGLAVADLTLPPLFDALTGAQRCIQVYEMAVAFAAERRTPEHGFSDAFSAQLAAGLAVSGEAYFAARRLADQAQGAVAALFETVDVLIAPSTEGEAPAGLAATGDPLFNRLWSLMGNPCVHVPTGRGASGLPVGVTVVGPRWADALTLDAACTLEACVAQQVNGP